MLISVEPLRGEADLSICPLPIANDNCNCKFQSFVISQFILSFGLPTSDFGLPPLTKKPDMHSLSSADYFVFLFYFIVVVTYGIWIYRKKKAVSGSSTEFFLAEGQLTWWAIGASLIASNIAAEQFIGMSGNGFRLGLAISSYEWLAAVSLVIVAVFFM